MDKKQEVETIQVTGNKDDDFSGMHIKKKQIKNDYKYISHNPLFLGFSWFVTFLLIEPIFFIVGLIKARISYKNRKALKECKHKGYFIYGNHTLVLDPCYDASYAHFFKRSLILASHETFSICKIVTFLVRALGAIPVPNKGNDVMEKNFMDCMSYHINKHHNVIIYPEAHIWRYYNGIREFKMGSFRYPVLNNAPSYVFTKVYKKGKIRKKPRAIVYIEGPLYPNTSLKYEDAVKDLADRVSDIMKKTVKEHDSYAYINYSKQQNK